MEDKYGSSEYGLVMPFVTVTSKGGPHDDESYVAGWEMGQLDATLSQIPSFVQRLGRSFTIHADNREQADLIAMQHGWTATFSEVGEGWLHLSLTKVP